MSRPIPIRIQDELLEKIDAKAESTGVARADLIRQALEASLAPRETPQGIDCLIELSKSQIECMDQLAERAGLDRKRYLQRIIGERLRREFVDDRNRLLQDISHNGR